MGTIYLFAAVAVIIYFAWVRKLHPAADHSMLNQLKQVLAITGVGFMLSLTPLAAKTYDLPVRVIARADIHRLQFNEYSVRECLDVYNDDYNIPLIVTGVVADSWRGHQKHIMNEDWFENRPAITISPGTSARIVERKRVVDGEYRRNWWVRWLKLTITTSRGEFYSNFVASPFKRPGGLKSEHLETHIDTLSEPQALTPAQKEYIQKK